MDVEAFLSEYRPEHHETIMAGLRLLGTRHPTRVFTRDELKTFVDILLGPQALAPPPPPPEPPPPPTPPPAPADPELIVGLYRAQTERLETLIKFLALPVIAPLDDDGKYDPDVTSAYNVATETVLKHVRGLIIKDYPKQEPLSPGEPCP